VINTSHSESFGSWHIHGIFIQNVQTTPSASHVARDLHPMITALSRFPQHFNEELLSLSSTQQTRRAMAIVRVLIATNPPALSVLYLDLYNSLIE